MRIPARLPRLTTRRIIVLVALSAIVARGCRGGWQPGWHVPVGGGARCGVCRNDAWSPVIYGPGETGGATYQAGVWDARPCGPWEPAGFLRFGVKVSGGWGVPAGRWSVHAVGPGGETVAW